MQTLKDKDKQYIWHPYTSLATPVETIPIISGDGVYLVDEAGNRFIDAVSSWWVNLHEHAHPYIAESIYRQALELEQVIFAGFTHRPAVELAEKLVGILPGSMSKIFYSDNGSTATEVAIKMALQYRWNRHGDNQRRKKILAFHDAYHGDTFGAMSISARSIFTQAFQDKLFDVLFIEKPNQQNSNDIMRFIETNADDIAAFIYEPLLQGAGGMKMYNAEMMNNLLSACKRNDILCIADEVLTGFGRTGKSFASEYLEHHPDIVCLSKGLTGGTMALGVTACNQKVVDAFNTSDKLKTFFHGHSFTANPIACRAALASLELLLRPECQQQIAMINTQHLAFAAKISTNKNILNCRCLGTIIAFEVTSSNNDYLNNISQACTAFMLQHHVYLRPLGNTIYIMPPYVITAGELQQVYDALNLFFSAYLA